MCISRGITKNIAQLSDVLIWNLINSAFIERITPNNASDRQPSTFYKAMFLNRTISVLRTGWVKPAISVWIEEFHESVIKR